MSSQEPTVVSASGKVLLAGGYLVLDQKYSGVVVSTSSRFYTVIESASTGKPREIIVRSPQFVNAEWAYSVKVEGDQVIVTQAEGAAKNKFVHIALQISLRLAHEIRGATAFEACLKAPLLVTIVGGNDFYSQRAKLAELGLEPRISSLAQIPPFAYTGVSLSAVHKTGLGSSAALTTSLVGALLSHFSAVSAVSLSSSSSSSSDAFLIHSASQAAHCLAQGKVGSGFDVAAAVFGSQRYRRFGPNVLEPLMSEAGEGGVKCLLAVLGEGNKGWDHKIEPFQLPPGTRLMLADVDAGSDTPSLVGKVLKWHKSEGEVAVAFWDSLAALNLSFAQTLLHLSDFHKSFEEVYNSTFKKLTDLPAKEWSSQTDSVSQAVLAVRNHAESIRGKMREMGSKAGVPIEPPEQTRLLDACLAEPGVIAGGVPGAGGYDALWLLVFSPDEKGRETPLKRVERVWTSWKEMDVSPLEACESFEKGLRSESVEGVPGLKEVLRGLN